MGKKARFDFSSAEDRIDAVARNAEARLRALVSDDAFQNLRDFARERLAREKRNRAIPEPGRVSFQVRLGRAKLTLEQVAALDVGVLATLLDSANGQVQIWSEGRMRGRGALLVVDGKLAVGIEEFEG
ncbi:MAG: FliM/FliN family flagellar motor switch protein [Thermoguttaceae bacterium]|nr:FliM/FliN family flagellar motor switch protein [Thermoguttaceae bacterium]